jgi:hypothetical protein
MKPHDRQQWLLNHMRANPTRSFDCLDTEFVLKYAESTQAACLPQFFGAPKCKTLGRDLGDLFRAGLLRRHSIGLQPGDASMGFPKWVWSYRL